MATVGTYISIISEKLKIAEEKVRGLELWTKKYGKAKPRLENNVDINKLWPVSTPQFADIIYFIGFLTKIPLKEYNMTYRSRKCDYKWKDLKENNKLISKQLKDDLYVHYMNTYLIANDDIGYYFNLNMDNADVLKYYILWGFGPEYNSILPELKDDKYCSNYIDRVEEKVNIVVTHEEKINISNIIDKSILLSISFPADENIDHVEFGTQFSDGYHDTYVTTYDNDYMKYIDKIINPRETNGYSISFTNGRIGYYPVVENTYMSIFYKNNVKVKSWPFIFVHCSSIE